MVVTSSNCVLVLTKVSSEWKDSKTSPTGPRLHTQRQRGYNPLNRNTEAGVADGVRGEGGGVGCVVPWRGERAGLWCVTSEELVRLGRLVSPAVTELADCGRPHMPRAVRLC